MIIPILTSHLTSQSVPGTWQPLSLVTLCQCPVLLRLSVTLLHSCHAPWHISWHFCENLNFIHLCVSRLYDVWISVWINHLFLFRICLEWLWARPGWLWHSSPVSSPLASSQRVTHAPMTAWWQLGPPPRPPMVTACPAPPRALWSTPPRACSRKGWISCRHFVKEIDGPGQMRDLSFEIICPNIFYFTAKYSSLLGPGLQVHPQWRRPRDLLAWRPLRWPPRCRAEIQATEASDPMDWSPRGIQDGAGLSPDLQVLRVLVKRDEWGRDQ